MRNYIAIAILSCLGIPTFAADMDNPVDAISAQSQPTADGMINLATKDSVSLGVDNVGDASIDAITDDISIPDTLTDSDASSASNSEAVVPVQPNVAKVDNTPALASPVRHEPVSTESTTVAVEQTFMPVADSTPPSLNMAPTPAQPPVENAIDRLVVSSPKDAVSPMPIQTVATTAPSQHYTPWNRPELEFGILAGASGGYIPVNESLVDTFPPPGPARFRFQLSGEGFSGGIGGSAMYRRGNHTFGASITGYLDTHSMKNYDHKQDIYSITKNPSITYMDRSYTLEFAGKFGHYFRDYHLYGKLGVMCSAFQYKYRGADIDDTHNITAWGGVAGIGLEKIIDLPALGESKIGLQYNYQLYETLTPVVKYATNISTSKLRPRYHNGYLTISKTF